MPSQTEESKEKDKKIRRKLSNSNAWFSSHHRSNQCDRRLRRRRDRRTRIVPDSWHGRRGSSYFRKWNGQRDVRNRQGSIQEICYTQKELKNTCTFASAMQYAERYRHHFCTRESFKIAEIIWVLNKPIRTLCWKQVDKWRTTYCGVAFRRHESVAQK